MEWIKFTEEKPKNSDYYFITGKGGRKALMYYYSDVDEWDLNGYALNHFNESEIYWLNES